jgi:hypothetical protein
VLAQLLTDLARAQQMTFASTREDAAKGHAYPGTRLDDAMRDLRALCGIRWCSSPPGWPALHRTAPHRTARSHLPAAAELALRRPVLTARGLAEGLQISPRPGGYAVVLAATQCLHPALARARAPRSAHPIALLSTWPPGYWLSRLQARFAAWVAPRHEPLPE